MRKSHSTCSFPSLLFTKLPKNCPSTRSFLPTPTRRHTSPHSAPKGESCPHAHDWAPPVRELVSACDAGTRRARLVPILHFSIARFTRSLAPTRHTSPSSTMPSRLPASPLRAARQDRNAQIQGHASRIRVCSSETMLMSARLLQARSALSPILLSCSVSQSPIFLFQILKVAASRRYTPYAGDLYRCYVALVQKRAAQIFLMRSPGYHDGAPELCGLL